jgi:hypothetical protein
LSRNSGVFVLIEAYFCVHSWATDEKTNKNQREKTEFRPSKQIPNKLLGANKVASDSIARAKDKDKKRPFPYH